MKDDHQTWQQAVSNWTRQYEQMTNSVRAELDQLIDSIMQIKENMVTATLAAESASICRTCGGECCLHGKFHFSVLDLLAYRKSGVDPLVVQFTPAKHCPYSGETGCLMPPRFRPMTCVIFNCHEIEDRMGTVELTKLNECEQKLRAAIAQASRITGSRLERPLLLSCQP